MIYLDNAATTSLSPSVLCAMLPYLMQDYGNPGSDHPVGRKARKAVDEAREKVASLVSCQPEQVVFTSGGSEANNLAILGTLQAMRQQGKTHLILSPVEHESAYAAAEAAKTMGFSVDYVPLLNTGGPGKPDRIRLDLDALDAMIRPETALVSVMTVNNETGDLFSAAKVSGVCKAHGVLYHTDCVQAPELAKMAWEFADLISVSAHKLHGPKGIGALFVKDRALLSPLIHGGQNQEHGLRAGTENVPAIVGFGQAVFELLKRGHDARTHTAYMGFLRRFDEQMLALGLDDAWMPGRNTPRFRITIDRGRSSFSCLGSDRILSLTIQGVDAQTLVLLAGENGLCISSGSACDTHSSQPSRVLLACGYTPEEARQTVRLSFDHTVSYNDAVKAAEILADCVSLLLQARTT